MTTVAIAMNLRRSKMIPRIPNIKAAGIEMFISNPPRAARGLPHPGRSIIITPAVRAATTSNVIAVVPKRILVLQRILALQKHQIKLPLL